MLYTYDNNRLPPGMTSERSTDRLPIIRHEKAAPLMRRRFFYSECSQKQMSLWLIEKWLRRKKEKKEEKETINGQLLKRGRLVRRRSGQFHISASVSEYRRGKWSVSIGQLVISNLS